MDNCYICGKDHTVTPRCFRTSVNFGCLCPKCGKFYLFEDDARNCCIKIEDAYECTECEKVVSEKEFKENSPKLCEHLRELRNRKDVDQIFKE